MEGNQSSRIKKALREKKRPKVEKNVPMALSSIKSKKGSSVAKKASTLVEEKMGRVEVANVMIRLPIIKIQNDLTAIFARITWEMCIFAPCLILGMVYIPNNINPWNGAKSVLTH